MTDQDDVQQAIADCLQMIDRVVQQNLADPDLRGLSAEFRAGYARGQRDALMVFFVKKLQKRLHA